MTPTLKEVEEGRIEFDSETALENPNHCASSCNSNHQSQVANEDDENVYEVGKNHLRNLKAQEVKPDASHTKEHEEMNNPSPSIARGWQHLVKIFKKRDDDMVRDYDEEINTLLVFAGLFSAVLTAFIIDAYKRLEEDSAEASVLILRRISIQLEGSSSVPPMPPPHSDYSPTKAIIAVNLLWFSSLLLSLFAALFGILAKQWIRAYNKWSEGDKLEDMLFLRFFYREGFEEYHASEIIGALPVFLQLALLLFTGGLVTYLWTLHHVVAIFVTAIASLMVVIALYTILLPVFQAKCAYKTPLVLFLAALRERKLFLTYISYGIRMFFYMLFLCVFIVVGVFSLFLRLFKCDAGLFDWICNSGNEFDKWILKKPSSGSPFPSRWRDLDYTRVPRLSFNIACVDNIVKHVNLILDIRPQSRLETLLDKHQLDGTVAALKISELDETMKQLLFELCLPPVLNSSSESNQHDWRTAQHARRIRCLLDFIDRSQGGVVSHKIQTHVVQRYCDQNIHETRIKAANLYRKLVEELVFKPPEDAVALYLRSLTEAVAAINAGPSTPSNELLKYSAAMYHEIWKALYLWLEFARRCDFTSSPGLIQECQNHLKDLSNIYLARLSEQPLTLKKLASHDSLIRFSPNGSVILTWDTSEINSNSVLVWNSTTGENSAILRGHRGLVRTVAFSPDSSLVMTGSDDCTGRIWDIISGDCTLTIKRYKSPICAAAFSPTGTEVVIGSEDETAHTWSSTTGNYIKFIGSYLDPVLAVRFSPNGSQVVLGMRDGRSRLEKITSAGQSRDISASFSGNGICEFAFSADGLYLLITRFDDETFEIWSTVTGKQIFCVDGHDYPLVSVAFSPNGRHIISRDTYGLTRIWNTLDYISYAIKTTSSSPPVFMLDRQTRIIVAKNLDTNQVVPVYCIPDDEEIPDEWVQDSSEYKVAFRLGSGHVVVIDSEPMFIDIAGFASTEIQNNERNEDQRLPETPDEEKNPSIV